ncbi:hypothetical protein ACIGO8_03410 [Streptomyces sp. NPDC053493]|uniref:hypothetical protein n=1 Tax=Streptomyces sp. NPDC053493 TaxID=3365705 RepID=UPI0037D7D723
MSQYDTGGSEPPRRRRRHASGRRPGPLWMIGSGAVVLLGVLAAVTALDSGPAGRAPALDDGHPGMPALIQPGPGGDDGSADGPATPGGRPSGSASGPAPADGSATATPSGPASAAPSAPAGTASPSPTAGSSADPGHPGKSGSAPGKVRKAGPSHSTTAG